MLATILFVIALNMLNSVEATFKYLNQNAESSSPNHLNFDISNDKVNLIEEEINIEENQNNTIIANNYYNSMQAKNRNQLQEQEQLPVQKEQQQQQPSMYATPQKKVLKFDELSNKLKQEALIDVFKIKLLELLDLDEAPSPQEFHINKNPVPEPIMREYNKLLKLSQENNHELKTSAYFSRRSRDKASEMSHDKELNLAEELIRFNSSIVQEVTLLPHKVRSKDDPANMYLNQNKIDWCNNNETKISNQELTVLSCFKFSLEQKEFILNDIKSAEMYIKLDITTINELLKLSAADNLDGISNLYLEVNGHLIKQFDLLKDNQNSNLFEYADIRDLIENVTMLSINLNHQKHYHHHQHKMTLRVRLLSLSSLTESFLSPLDNEQFLKLFANIDESVALHIKFGEQKPESKESHSRSKRQQQYLHSGSNDSSGNSRGRGHNSRYRSGHTKHHSKNYRDCADLRKIGQTPSNFSCCRETISFSMEQIGWSHWILSPKVIEYKYCRGGCVSKYLIFFLN